MDLNEYRSLIAKNPSSKKKKRRGEPEHELQASCIDLFHLLFKDRIIYAIPNGGFRNKSEAIKLKKEGVLSGVSDLCIPEPMHGFHGVYCETKVGKNTTTENQDWFLAKMKQRGYYTFVYYTQSEFLESVRNYFSGKVSKEWQTL
jgi:hypothetical protein